MVSQRPRMLPCIGRVPPSVRNDLTTGPRGGECRGRNIRRTVDIYCSVNIAVKHAVSWVGALDPPRLHPAGLSPGPFKGETCNHIYEFVEDDHAGRWPVTPGYQRLRDQMVALIAAPDWRPGEAIPTERALSQSYGVAVGTV